MNNLEKCTMPEVYRHNVIQYLFSGMSMAHQIDCNDLAEGIEDSSHVFHLRALSFLHKNRTINLISGMHEKIIAKM